MIHLDEYIDDDPSHCMRCSSNSAYEDSGYCLNCICSYRRYFGSWPYLPPPLRKLFNQ